uniref:Uncharacterized protein n=1 Tax=Magnetospirillum gryphiswaldense TaxID=55518 RepID=A4TVM7_9PROT|nr:hypothetical protein MGR_2794 [Magnetospirillum gryphiswaldense MSR-1]
MGYIPYVRTACQCATNSWGIRQARGYPCPTGGMLWLAAKQW